MQLRWFHIRGVCIAPGCVYRSSSARRDVGIPGDRIKRVETYHLARAVGDALAASDALGSARLGFEATPVVDADHGESESRSRRRRGRCCGLWEQHKGIGVAPEGICTACRARSINSTTVGLDQYFHLGAGTSPYLPLGYFNDFPGPPFTSVVATEEVSTKVTRSPAIPTIVPTVKTPVVSTLTTHMAGAIPRRAAASVGYAHAPGGEATTARRGAWRLDGEARRVETIAPSSPPPVLLGCRHPYRLAMRRRFLLLPSPSGRRWRRGRHRTCVHRRA
jgi:hypothetical protein